jgi:hypothetical protein
MGNVWCGWGWLWGERQGGKEVAGCLKKHFLSVQSEEAEKTTFQFDAKFPISISEPGTSNAPYFPSQGQVIFMALSPVLDKESIALANYVLSSSANVKIIRPSQDSELLVLTIFHAPEPVLPCPTIHLSLCLCTSTLSVANSWQISGQ